MKKNGATYRLFEGWMYPLACCSRTNLSNAFCSSCVSWYTFPGIDDGAPSFNLIGWSHMQGSGNLWEAFSLNTERWWWYLAGIFPLPICDLACSASLEASVCFLLFRVGRDTWATCMESMVGDVHRSGLLLLTGVIMHCLMCDSMAFLVCSISGSWVLLIHPHAQSIFGWFGANHR